MLEGVIMIQFTKPTNLNGAELCDEIEAVGIHINRATSPRLDDDGSFWLDISAKDESKVADIVAAHNGTTVAPEPTIEDKLTSVGLNLNDLKTALGLA
jgi:hypothetical protein